MKRDRSNGIEDNIPATNGSVERPDWYDRARKTFNRLYRQSITKVLADHQALEFDGNVSAMGKVIEAWAIRAIGEDTGEARLGRMILGDYFSGRYPGAHGDGEGKANERGYNLNGEAFYFVKAIRSRSMIDRDTGEYAIATIKIFRDYDRSPKTFSYGPDNR